MLAVGSNPGCLLRFKGAVAVFDAARNNIDDAVEHKKVKKFEKIT